jgi:hypothetical protein
MSRDRCQDSQDSTATRRAEMHPGRAFCCAPSVPGLRRSLRLLQPDFSAEAFRQRAGLCAPTPLDASLRCSMRFASVSEYTVQACGAAVLLLLATGCGLSACIQAQLLSTCAHAAFALLRHSVIISHTRPGLKATGQLAVHQDLLLGAARALDGCLVLQAFSAGLIL